MEVWISLSIIVLRAATLSCLLSYVMSVKFDATGISCWYEAQLFMTVSNHQGQGCAGFFKSVCFRVFKQLAHRVTHRIHCFWLLTRSRYAFSTLPTLSLMERK